VSAVSVESHESLDSSVGIETTTETEHNSGLSFLSSRNATMKAGIHPEYREVVFQDVSSDFSFKTRSTIKTKDTIQWEDGNEYPLVKVEVSSQSHPFYTGQHKIVDSGGRVDRFKQRYGKAKN
jgi:large subunit ribosomal protein L31